MLLLPVVFPSLQDKKLNLLFGLVTVKLILNLDGLLSFHVSSIMDFLTIPFNFCPLHSLVSVEGGPVNCWRQCHWIQFHNKHLLPQPNFLVDEDSPVCNKIDVSSRLRRR